VLADRTLQEGRIEGAARITAVLVKRAARALAGAQAAAAEAADPALTETESADTIDLSSDSLSLAIGSERSEDRRFRLILGAAVLTIIAGAAGYWYWGNDALTSGFDYTMPARARVSMPAPAPKVLMPTDEELEAYFRAMRGFEESLPEFPGNRHDLD